MVEFPSVVDATMLSAFRSCPQKFFRSYCEHWKPRGESIHLHAGAAFARGLEMARRAFFESGLSEESAIQAGLHALIEAYGEFESPEGSNKSLERMCGAFEFYFSAWPIDEGAIPATLASGKPAIEFSFAQPLPFRHPVTGDPIIYSGRSDMIASFAGGTYIEDDKTASQLGASWSRQWDLRSQFTGYCWAARESGIPVNGVLVRGISILKTKYDRAEAITYRSGWEVDRWLKQVLRDLARMQACWEACEWDYNLDHACSEYGGCAFNSVCKSPDPATWLPLYFEQRVWDPLERTEHVVQSPV